MRDFMINEDFEVVETRDQATRIFDHLESYANGMRFQVQRKNENGLWGGRGDDERFTFPYTSATRSRVIAFYRQIELSDED